MKRRLLSILLLICMTLTLFPVPAFAEEGMGEAPVCVCTGACTEEAVNYACPVCGTAGAQACTCAEKVIVIDAADAASDAGDADDVGGADDAVYSAYAANAPAEEEAAAGVTYILYYYLNDGTDNCGQVFNTKNEIIITQVPTRDGYDFIGWADSSDAAEAQYKSGDAITIDEGTEKTVYAVWKRQLIETVITTPPTLPKEAYIGRTFGDGSLNGGEAKVKGTDTVVPGKFTFKNFDDGGVRAAGENRLRVHFIPVDQETYAAAECEVIVTGLKHTITEVRTKIAITDKPLGTPVDELGITAESVEVKTNVGTIYSPIPVTWDLSTYDPNKLGTQIIYGTLDVAKSWYAYAINEETDVKATIEVTLIDTRVFETTIVEAPVISKTFYALEHYEDLEASLTGGVAMADGKEIEGTFAFDENEPLYGKQAWPRTSLKYGELTRTVVFTPTNTRNYTTATCTVTVNILPLKVIQISSFYTPITDKPVGTEFADLGLWDKVSFVASENRDDPPEKWIHYDDDVTWDVSQYDKDSPYEQTITGTLSLRYWKDYMLPPDEPLTLSVKVKLKYDPVAPTIVTAPVFRWTKGDYALGDNQIFVNKYFQLETKNIADEAAETGALIGGEAKAGDTKVSGTFSIKEGTPKWFSTEGQHEVTIVFTPDDTVLYAPAECKIKIDAIKRTVASIIPCPDVTDEEVGTAFEKLWKPTFVNLRTEDGTIESGVGVTWDEAAYDPYTLEEQTITGSLKLSGYIGSYVKQPEPEIKATLKIKLKSTENTFEIYYRLFNSKGDAEYEVAGGGVLLTDYVSRDALADYKLRGYDEIFSALQRNGHFVGMSINGAAMDGWYSDRDFTSKIETAAEMNTAGRWVYLYAKNVPKTFEITLELDGGTLPEGVSSTVALSYGTWYKLPTPARHGYVFDGWYTEETGGDRIWDSTPMIRAENHSVYAHWKFDHSTVFGEFQKPSALVKAADCENDAVYYWSCAGCDMNDTSRTFTASGTALDHDYIWTSNGNGTHNGVCTRDASHTTTEDCSGGMATCTKKAVCTFCGKEYGELAPHSYTEENTDVKYLKTAATCTAKAVYYKSCAACGAAGTETFENGEPIPHSYTAENTDAKYLRTAASCTAKAVYYKSCTACGAAGTDTFEYGEPIPHSYTAENTDTKYLKTAATCTAKAVYCKSCAACGAAGTETFEYGTVNPDNHSGRAEWTVTASTHEQKWSCCGKVTVSAEGHSFGEWVVAKSPTYSQRGIRTHTCEQCGYAESEYIPATGSGKTPRTGDDSALGLWSLLMCTSLTGALSLTAFVFKRRTKKER